MPTDKRQLPGPSAVPNSELVSTPTAHETQDSQTLLTQMIHNQQLQLAEYFKSSKVAINTERFAMEITLVARLAVVDGQYAAAGKLYELAGKHIGAIDTKNDLHQHVHLHNQSSETELARAPDEALRKLVDEASLSRQLREAMYAKSKSENAK